MIIKTIIENLRLHGKEVQAALYETVTMAAYVLILETYSSNFRKIIHFGTECSSFCFAQN